MSNLNHGRPFFKVMDAGGGERIRTIDEELDVANVGTSAGRSSQQAVPRCELCGSTKVSSRRLRCTRCVAETAVVHDARVRPTGAGVRPAVRPTARQRGTFCTGCHTELPVSGACGFCT